MDIETSRYIRNYFTNLFTTNEWLALRHYMYTYKVDHAISDSSNMREHLIKKGLIRSEPEILELLKNGYNEFELNIAKRIMSETPDKVFFNNCPKCNKLARTPYTRQCRYCKHNWHDLIVAQFKIESSFQITGRMFFFLGQITKGQIKEGNFIDLTLLGLNKQPKIEVIEFALRKQNGKTWEDIALGTNELTEEEKEYIKSRSTLAIPFDIITNNKTVPQS